MKILDFTAIVLFVLALAGVPVLLVSWPLYLYSRVRANENAQAVTRKKNIATNGTKGFLVVIALLFAMSLSGASAARRHVMDTITLLAPGYTVSVNSRNVENAGQIIDAFNGLHWSPGHHSHPTKKINIEIRDQSNNIALVVARDSQDSREYWVFLPGYWITSRMEIGRIRTAAFDAF